MRHPIALASRSLLLMVSLLGVSPALADGAPEDPRRAEARAHFERGVAHVDRSEWDAALAEFLASRKALATSKNTYNAAVCLRKMNRFDEALEMYETLLRDYPDISAEDRKVAERERAQLESSVGAIELRGGLARATVVVDGRERGVMPLEKPLRVGAGSHQVRVSAEGYLPFEARVDVTGMQKVDLEVKLAALTAGGRLNVAEQTGKNLDVVVDNATVGKTPWEGVLAPGEHTVLLRGEGNVGTPPVRPNVTLGQVVSLNLLGEELGGPVKIEPVPAQATVLVDGIELGRGAWEGRLRPGTHKLTATADGYLPFERAIVSEMGKATRVPAALVRDPKALGGQSAAFVLEANAGLPIGLVSGGSDLSDACTGSCSSGVPLGLRAAVHGAYQTGSGFGAGLSAGYLLTFASISDRDTALRPRGRADNLGKADDALRLSGLTLGAAAHYHGSGAWPLFFRLGAGVVLAQVADARTGAFTNSLGETYTVDAKTSSAATYFYVAPEVRLAHTIGKNLEITFGVEVDVLTALAKPTWNDGTTLLTSNRDRGDGLATFGEQSTVGSLLVLVAPSVGLRYELR